MNDNASALGLLVLRATQLTRDLNRLRAAIRRIAAGDVVWQEVETCAADAESAVARLDAAVRQLGDSEGSQVELCTVTLEAAVARLQTIMRKVVERDVEGLRHDPMTQRLYRALRLH